MSTTTLNEDPKLSFWEVGGYKPNIRRIRSGATQLDDYAKMIKERLEIEQKYGKSLQNWHAKWASHVETAVPDNIVKSLWLELLKEGREMSQTHLSVKDRCNDELLKTLHLFHKENYHHATLRGMRETREMDDEFEKAQRQWKKLLEKAETAKKNYHIACRSEKSTYIQLMNLQGDASTASENTDKTRERHEKCRETVKKTKKIYEATLCEIRQFNPVYTENMTFVFEKCQQLELKRLRFAMEMLSGFENALFDLVNPLKLSQLHSSLQAKFREISDVQLNDDLREWSKTYGVEAPMTSPLFQEYSPELRKIADSASMRRSTDDDNSSVVLTKQVITSNDLYFPELRKVGDSSSISISTKRMNNDDGASSIISKQLITSKKSYSPESNKMSALRTPKRSNDDDALSVALTQQTAASNASNDSSGNQLRGPARVLYDYVPIESDEIPLTKNELLEVISGPDSLGWAYGRCGNREGLFPASYVASC